MRPLQIGKPALDRAARGIEIEPFVLEWVFFKVGQGQFEQCRRRTQMIFLQMHKRTGELNQAFVKRAVRAVFIVQPDVLEDFVRLVKKLVIKAMEIADVILVELVSLMLLHQLGDAFVFATHGFRVKAG